MTDQSSTAIVVIGGDPPHPGVVAHLPSRRIVIAADSGLDHAQTLGLQVDLVIGDLDSVSPEALARAEADGVPIDRHPADKDATDTELALDAAAARGHRHVVVVSGGGDRLDHLLGSLVVLARPDTIAVEAWIGPAHVVVLHGPTRRVVTGPPGSTVSLLALGGAASGVTTDGLRWALHDEDLPWGSSRGISNELLADAASVSVTSGTLAVIAPAALEEPHA